jgi:hypothetical protein
MKDADDMTDEDDIDTRPELPVEGFMAHLCGQFDVPCLKGAIAFDFDPDSGEVELIFAPEDDSPFGFTVVPLQVQGVTLMEFLRRQVLADIVEGQVEAGGDVVAEASEYLKAQGGAA